MKTRLIWDRAAFELVEPAEYARRQEERKPHDAFIVVKAVERGCWVYDKDVGALVDVQAYHAAKPRGQRSHLSAPSIHGDFADYTLCMADGVRYGSKGEYRKALRRNGCVEVGNEPIMDRPCKPEYTPTGVADDIKRALSEHGHAV